MKIGIAMNQIIISKAPWKIYNIGNNKPVQLMDYINALEKNLGKKAKINFLPFNQEMFQIPTQILIN